MSTITFNSKKELDDWVAAKEWEKNMERKAQGWSVSVPSFVNDILIGNGQNIRKLKDDIKKYSVRMEYWKNVSSDEEKLLAPEKIQKYNNFMKKANNKIKQIECWLKRKEKILADRENYYKQILASK